MCILLIGFTVPFSSLYQLSLAVLFLLLAVSFSVYSYYTLFAIWSTIVIARKEMKRPDSMIRRWLPQGIKELWMSVQKLNPNLNPLHSETWMEIERGAMEREKNRARVMTTAKILCILAVCGVAYALGNEHGYLKRDHELVTNVHFRSNVEVIWTDGKGGHIFLTDRGKERINMCKGGPIFALGTILSDAVYEIRQAPENCVVMTGGEPLGYKLAALLRQPMKEQ